MSPMAPLDHPLLDTPRLGVDPSQTLVVVAPHPDDEVIGFGGVLFDHNAVGGSVLVVTVTDGDAFDPSATEQGRRSAAARRRAEQLDGLAVIGITEDRVVRCGVPDGHVAEHLRDLEAHVRRILLGCASDRGVLVVVPWRADGHPDHVATNRAVRRSLGRHGRNALFEVPIWSWHHRHDISPEWSSLSCVPISDAARSAKRAALSCHRSQLRPLSGGRPAILSAHFCADFDRDAEVVVR